ncbi:MAG: hypothetical protein C4321_10515, partial [Chloroflexota bacterium]
MGDSFLGEKNGARSDGGRDGQSPQLLSAEPGLEGLRQSASRPGELHNLGRRGGHERAQGDPPCQTRAGACEDSERCASTSGPERDPEWHQDQRLLGQYAPDDAQRGEPVARALRQVGMTGEDALHAFGVHPVERRIQRKHNRHGWRIGRLP